MEDIMHINPYLPFNDQCEEAFKFYAQCFGGNIEMMLTNGQTPPEVASHIPAARHNLIMHASLRVGNTLLMGTDMPLDQYKVPQGISAVMNIEDAAETARVFNALAEGGAVRMPLQKTFFAQSFGVVTDRFGIPWMINCE
jgi:PhnB protein